MIWPLTQMQLGPEQKYDSTSYQYGIQPRTHMIFIPLTKCNLTANRNGFHWAPGPNAIKEPFQMQFIPWLKFSSRTDANEIHTHTQMQFNPDAIQPRP